MVWSNGDNTDVMDGGAGTDLAVVNGATAKDDVFTVGAGAGGRLAFARTNLVPFALDIGTTEGLTVNGVGGNDTFTVGDITAPPGELTMSLRQELTDIQYGRERDRHNWMYRLDA